jgi:hypothetical protein
MPPPPYAGDEKHASLPGPQPPSRIAVRRPRGHTPPSNCLKNLDPRPRPFRSASKIQKSVIGEAGHSCASRPDVEQWCKPFCLTSRTQVSHEASVDLWIRGGRPAGYRNHRVAVAFACDRPSFRGFRHVVVAKIPNRGQRKQASGRGVRGYVAGLFDRAEALKREGDRLTSP